MSDKFAISFSKPGANSFGALQVTAILKRIKHNGMLGSPKSYRSDRIWASGRLPAIGLSRPRVAGWVFDLMPLYLWFIIHNMFLSHA